MEKLKVIVVTVITQIIAYLPDIENILKVISLLIGIGYVIWRWHKDYRKEKKEKK